MTGGLVLIGAAAAAANGVLPGPVEDILREYRSYDQPFSVDSETAFVAARDTLEDGTVVEFWIAPTSDEGQCSFDLWTFPDGSTRRGLSACVHGRDQFPAEFPGLWVAFGESAAGGPRGALGHAPDGSATLTVTFTDGSTDVTELDADGYFMIAYPKLDGARVVSFIARDANGRLLDEVPGEPDLPEFTVITVGNP